MVLAYFGEDRTEENLVQLLGTKLYGTPIRHAEKLQHYGYKVDIAQLSQTDLEKQLNNGSPVVIRVWTMMLDYWDVETSHVVVVVGYDEEMVFINDPAFPHTPQQVSWDGLLAAWAEYDETAVFITPA